MQPMGFDVEITLKMLESLKGKQSGQKTQKQDKKECLQRVREKQGKIVISTQVFGLFGKQGLTKRQAPSMPVGIALIDNTNPWWDVTIV